MYEAPRALGGQSRFPLHLHGADSLLAGARTPEGVDPHLQGNLGLLHGGAGPHGVLIVVAHVRTVFVSPL